MSIFDNPDHLKLLQNLLNPKQRRNLNDSSSEDDDVDEPIALNNLTPAGIGPQASQKPNNASSSRNPKKPNPLATPLPANETKPEPKTLEEWQEMQEKEDAELLDTRKCPEYKMTYRQAVGTEDVFLQMGNRTGASASCEDLIVDIELPDETVSAEKMNLSITEHAIDLATPLYKLKLPLPHPVNVDRCRARFDADCKKLSLTLRLKRELDYVNF